MPEHPEETLARAVAGYWVIVHRHGIDSDEVRMVRAQFDGDESFRMYADSVDEIVRRQQAGPDAERSER